MPFKGGDAYQIEALAHKVYVDATYQGEWLAMIIAWAVIVYFEK